MSLMRARRCRAARRTRSSGSISSSRLKSRASSRSISVTPMMAFNGVRSSWLILARNCDLCWLAISRLAALVLDFLEQADVLDGYCRLVGKGGDKRNLLIGERAHLGAGQGEHAN